MNIPTYGDNEGVKKMLTALVEEEATHQAALKRIAAQRRAVQQMCKLRG